MNDSPEMCVPVRHLRELELALAGSSPKEDCLSLLRDLLATAPSEALPGTHPFRSESTQTLDQPALGQSVDAFGTAVLQALPAQIAALDATGQIVAINDSWTRFARENGGSLSNGLGVGTNYLDVCHRAHGERSEEAERAELGIRSVLDGQQSLFTLEYPCDAPDVRRWFLMQVTPLPVEPRGALVTHLDITGRKLAEELARRQQSHLAQVARMHTVGALATAVAHEISQPLAAIGIYSNAAAHLLEDGKADPRELAEVLRQIETQVARAGEIVGRVRELTRWRNAEKAQIDLCEAVAEAIRFTRPMATDRQVAIVPETPDEPIRVYADRVQIAQVIVNLLCNGIEAIALAGSRERRIDVSVRRQGAGACITVTDTGPGIRSGSEERIFDIFETDKATGSGMGLAISRSLIEGHGGRLWADPEHKSGAAFRFTLPGTSGGLEDSE